MEYLIKTGAIGMTEDQFFDFCQENDILKLERNSMGDIILMEPTAFYAGQRNMDILMKLSVWNEQHKLGVMVDSNTGFTLPNKAVRSPDGAFITNERWKSIDKDDLHKFAHICPDFVLELRSKSDGRKKLEEKMVEWVENGCRLGWLIDPKRKETVVYRESGETEIIPFESVLSGENVLPGFSLTLTTIFGNNDES